MTGVNGASFLTALQLADSFFPSGMYAHSQGLESMVARRWVGGPDDVRRYLRNLLVCSVMPSDGVALLSAHASATNADMSTVCAIDWHLHAMKLPEELRLASRHAGRRILDESATILSAQGKALAYEEFRGLVADGKTPGTGAVALGVVAHAAAIEGETALLMFCHSFAVGVLGAAQRLLPLTHTHAQEILHSLHETVVSLAAEIGGRHWEDMTSFTPQADIAAMLHENDEVRMFAS